MEKNDSLKASLILSIYDNLPFLKEVLKTVETQTCNAFEVIISEDGEHSYIQEFLSNYPFKHSWKHVHQPDTGWRKNRALNRAALAASTDYLIFIDGDCLLHPRFIEMHLKHAKAGVVLGGKRLKLDPSTSKRLLSGELDTRQLVSYAAKNMFQLQKSGLRFLEEAFFISPKGLFGFLTRLRQIKELRGCNMSFFKADLVAINGFDEDYALPAIGEDADLTWRFIQKGLKLTSVRNLAIVYHLYHPENWNQQLENLKMMNEKIRMGNFRCSNGMVKETTINGREQ